MLKAPRQFLPVIISFLFFSGTASSAIINVPADQPTINSGLSIAAIGDTILVAPGIYNEKNIALYGKILGSWFLTTGDTTYISQTIIQGYLEEGTPGVYFNSGSQIIYPVTCLSGFTIKYFDLGIKCESASPELNNLVIRDMGTMETGTGFSSVGGNPIIKNSTFLNCSGAEFGYGIRCNGGTLTLENVKVNFIWGNMDGYGIYCSQTNLILKNVIICHVFDRPGPFDNVIAGSGIVNSGGNISITNTIITKCARSIENRDNGNITISYSNIFGNIRHTDYVNFKNDFEDLEPFGLINKINANGDSCDAYFNISADPQFVDSSDPYFISIQPYLVYYPDLHLQKTSPCINAGTPTGAPLFDLDGTPRDALPDMGAYEYVSPVAVEESGPQEFRLLTNYPNPFNPSTTITYTLPEPAPVTLAVYSITGQKVVTLVDEAMGAGTHSVVFDGTDFPSGLYFYRLESSGYTKTGKMLLVK